MSENLHPLVVSLLGEHPVVLYPEPPPFAWFIGSGTTTTVQTAGQCWARCDYRWTWWQVGYEREVWREHCQAIAGSMPDGTWRCALHAMYWYDEHARTTGR